MKNFSDQLIEEYNLVEAYVSQAAGSDADRVTAEKAYKAELVNGPEQKVFYSGKGWFQKKIGSFDLDNFHKAYDKWFEDNGILDIFGSDGKLVNRGTYGKFVNLDKTEPAVKALRTLYGVQFNHDMDFLANKIAKATAAQKQQDFEDAEDTAYDILNKMLNDSLDNNITWKALKDWYKKYLPEMADGIKAKILVDLEKESGNYDLLNLEKVTGTVFGIIEPPKGSGVADDYRHSKYYDVNNTPSLLDTTKIESNPDIQKAINEIVKEFAVKAFTWISTAKAYLFLNKNYQNLLDRGEYKLSNKVEWIVYIDESNNKLYKTLFKDFDNKKGVMLINLEDDSDRANAFTSTMKPVAMMYDHDEGTNYGHYSWNNYNVYFNSKYPDALKKLKINPNSAPAQGFCQADWKVENTSGDATKWFDKIGKYRYECDSSG